MNKLREINPLLLLAMFLIPLALVIAAVPENTTKPYKLTVEQLLSELTVGSQYFSSDDIADLIVKKDPSIQLIDVRSESDFKKYHLPGAINIPLTDVLYNENEEVLNQDVKTNVFYSNGTVDANQAWLICTQLGYKNNYVLQGGLNYWAESIISPKKPGDVAPNDEFAKYDYRKAMSSALGGGSLEAQSAAPAQSGGSVPVIQKKAKKKKGGGGC
jgi:rhodanese-related sulfurtransferase